MEKEKYLENYPLWIVFFSNLVSIAVYLIGVFIVSRIGFIWVVLYIILIGMLELQLIKGHCINCYYYGKTCAFGKGKISSIFFKKGNLEDFCKRHITWEDIIPDFMISLMPIVIGVVIIIKDFNWTILSLIITLLVLTFIGNGVIRNKLACRFCKQRKIGCPAQELFEKKK